MHQSSPSAEVDPKGRHKRESKNAKQMRNTKQNCFSHSSASPRNDKQCSAKQCFANQTNRCLAGFASGSDLFRDNERLTNKIVEKLISDISFCKPCTQPCDLRKIVIWLLHTCFAKNLILESSNVFFVVSE